MKPVFLLGEAMGQNEEKLGAPFVGSSGVELLKMLNEAGALELTSADRDYINRYYREGNPNMLEMVWRLHPEFHRSNVFNIHPPGNRLEWFCGGAKEAIKGFPSLIKGKKVRDEFSSELDRLGDELITVDPNLVVCLGNTALWALMGKTGVSKLRGTTGTSTHTASGYKCLAAYHPAAVIRQWELRPVTILDFAKINREKEYPDVRRPHRQIWIEPTVEDIKRFIADYILSGTQLSVDIETAGNRVTCIGFAPSPSLAIVIPFDDTRRKDGNYWPTVGDEREVWGLIKGVLENPRIKKTFQNGLYDIPFLWRSYRIRTLGASHDTMLLHHALQPEAPKALGFLGSVYTDEGPWKTERKATETIKRDE